MPLKCILSASFLPHAQLQASIIIHLPSSNYPKASSSLQWCYLSKPTFTL